MERLRFQAFRDSLSVEENEEIVDLAERLQISINAENFSTTYLGNTLLSSTAEKFV